MVVVVVVVVALVAVPMRETPKNGGQLLFAFSQDYPTLSLFWDLGWVASWAQLAATW